jgi:hypothetical protein
LNLWDEEAALIACGLASVVGRQLFEKGTVEIVHGCESDGLSTLSQFTSLRFKIPGRRSRCKIQEFMQRRNPRRGSS